MLVLMILEIIHY